MSRAGLAKYGAIAAAAARRALAERAALFGRLVFLGLIMFIFSRVWQRLLESGALEIGRAGDLIWYLAITEWCVLSLPPVFLAIEADVRSGDIATRLVRPVSYVGAQIADALGETALRLALLAPMGAVMAYVLAGGLPSNPSGLALALPLGLLASTLAVLTLVAIGLSAFWIVDTSPVFWIWQKLLFTLGGLLVPLELYPSWLRTAALWTPFPAMLAGPGRMAFGVDAALALQSALTLCVWLALTAAALVWLSSRAHRRLTVNGG